MVVLVDVIIVVLDLYWKLMIIERKEKIIDFKNKENIKIKKIELFYRRLITSI